MSDLIDQALPGSTDPAGPSATAATAVLDCGSTEGRPLESIAPVVSMRMRPAPEPPRSMTPTTTKDAPTPAAGPAGGGSVSSGPSRPFPSGSRRPGAVGGVTVRAPLLDPTRAAATPQARPHVSSSGRRQAPAHPRLADRQRSIRRSERVALLRPFLLPVALVATLASGAWVVLLSPLMSVSTVVLRFNGSAAEQQEISRIITPMRNNNLLRLDVGNRESALRSLPWVATATVRRSFPRTVEVSVTAHDVAGAVQLPDGRVALTATDGSVLSIVDADDASVLGLPSFDLGLTAIPAPNDSLADPAPAVLSSAKAIERRLPGRLQRVVLRDSGVEWLLKPTDGRSAARVLVGRPRDSDVPAAALASVLSRPGPMPNTIDLRTPDTPILTFAAVG